MLKEFRSIEYNSLIQSGFFHKPDFLYIYYKNMRIEWVLEDFTNDELVFIAKQLEKDKHILYIERQRIFICKTQQSWKKLEKLLMQHYHDNMKKLPDNLISLSLENYFSDK